MSTRRGYDLVCPIARALDRVGDRWTLLILRDLHAGPARFSDLETGLGTASNLLSSRLRDLTDEGLVARTEHGAYALTKIGEHTAGVILELATLGLHFDPPPTPKRPGNLRMVYLPLQAALRAAPVWPELRARLVVDDESFIIRSSPSDLTVHYNDVDSPADIVLSTSYDAIMAVSDGDITLDQFLDQLEIIEGPDFAPAFFELYQTGAIARWGAGPSS
jgi:DNA-binding HxlR family transcriptional regulator